MVSSEEEEEEEEVLNEMIRDVIDGSEVGPGRAPPTPPGLGKGVPYGMDSCTLIHLIVTKSRDYYVTYKTIKFTFLFPTHCTVLLYGKTNTAYFAVFSLYLLLHSYRIVSYDIYLHMSRCTTTLTTHTPTANRRKEVVFVRKNYEENFIVAFG